MINKIREKLSFMQKCYIERNNDNVDELKKLLFGKDNNPIIIGTGGFEWCTDDKTVTELFTDDWQYWGDFAMNLDTLKCSCGEKYGNFSVTAGVTYNTNTDEDYEDFMNLVSETDKSKQSSLQKLGFLLWFSSIVMGDKDKTLNKYTTTVNMSGIFEICDEEPVFRSLHFAVAMDQNEPDIRIDDKEERKNFDEVRESLKIYIADNETAGDAANLSFIKNAIKDLFAGKEIKLEEKTDNYYMNANCIDSNINKLNDYISCLHKDGYKVDIDSDNIFVNKQSNEFYFIGVGVYNSRVDLDAELNRIVENIDNYKALGGNREAMFVIRRDLAYLLKKYTVSENCTVPVRFEGRGIADNSDVKFSYFKVTYPNDWFFEDKNKYVYSSK